MKKALISIFSFLAIVVLFAACKKKDVERSTTEKIQAKWNVTSDRYNDYYGGMDHVINYPVAAGDYVDFRTDGNVYVKFGAFMDTSAYVVQADNKIIFNSDIYDIQTLTDNELKLNSRLTTSTSPLEFEETTLQLNK